MRLIVITQPDIFPGEAKLASSLFRAGLKTLHLRKPGSSAAQLAQLLDELRPEDRSRIMLHQHHQLASQYKVKVRRTHHAHAPTMRVAKQHGLD